MEDTANARVGACSPLIYSMENPTRVDFAGLLLYRSAWTIRHIDDPQVGEHAFDTHPESVVLSARALFLRNAAVRDIGLFDPTFFMYWEDVDYCMRLLNAGWHLRLLRSTTILHKGFASSGGETGPFALYYFTRNRFLMWRKHTRGRIDQAVTLTKMLITTAFQMTIPSVRHIPKVRRAFALGVLDGLLGYFGKRHEWREQ